MENCILKANDALRRRDWLVIKYFVKNQINKRNEGSCPVRITKCTDLFLLSHVSWTEEETEAVFKHVSFFVRQGRYPGKLDCENCILKANDALRRRDWLVIKYFVKNQINKRIDCSCL